MARMRKLRAEISDLDSVERFSKYLGVDVFLGEATFEGPNAVRVNGQVLKFLRCTIATGARPLVPEESVLPGIKDVHFLTSENVFDLTE